MQYRCLRLAVCMLGVAASALMQDALAAPPQSASLVVDVTAPSKFWSGMCGVPVYIRYQGTFNFRYFTGSSGTVVREIDTERDYKQTVFSPLSLGGTGKTFTYAVAEPLRFVYPEGASIGAPVVIYDAGLGGFYGPGVNVAGLAVMTGEVIYIDSSGAPIVETTGLLSREGHQVDFSSAIAARCGFLSNP